jgi:two-component system phosphate regulon sensor histidine kinase PhoR
MRLPRSLHWRIALAYTALILVTMGAVSIYLVNFVRDTYISNLEERLVQEARLLSEATTGFFSGAFDSESLQDVTFQTGDIVKARATIIGQDGTVLADAWKDPSSMENLANRPEFGAALRAGLGRSTRMSGTDGEEMLYTAVPIQDGGDIVGVARLAVPTSRIQANVNRIIATIAISALVVALLSIGLGYYIARRTSRSMHAVAEGARRLAGGDLEHQIRVSSTDETQEVADAFNAMAETIRDMIRDLSGERNKLSALLDTMADGVIVIEPDGRVVLMNRASEWLLGAKVEDAVGSRLVEIVRDHEIQRLVSQSLRSGRLQHVEMEMLHRRRFLSAIATPLSQNGSDQGVLLTLHDLTSIRQLETTRKEFVSNVSHELRNPLASIKAMVETLEGGAIEDHQIAQDFLHRIHRDVDRMTSMVNDLLELSRLEIGQVAVHLSPVDIRPVIDDLVEQYQGRSRTENIVVESSLPEDLPLVIGEEDKLRQVLVNLLENAFRFTPEQGRICVSALLQPQFVEIQVSDTGAGIAAEHIPHVFERFYKVDRSRRDEGTGLGLAIVKHIVQAQGGDVRVESREGVGSTFAFTARRAT